MSEDLGEYRRKRKPGATPEPGVAKPAKAAKAAKPAARKKAEAKAGPKPVAAGRFVVQEHHATRLHWDLRLEHDGILASWAVPNGIPDDPERNRKAVRTEDHPLEYLDFHGDIPTGQYGAGTMTIWDQGTYVAEKWRDDEVIATFTGERLNGRYALVATKDDWLLHRMDPPADPAAAELLPTPGTLEPMLARAGKPPPGEGWAYEVKWDGLRCLAYSEPGRVHLAARSGTDITARYPELRQLDRALSHHRAVLDGEIVAFGDDGRPSFEALQGRMHLTQDAQIRRKAKERPVTFVLFDLLWLDGRSLLDAPWAQRRALLEELGLETDRVRVPAPARGHAEGEALLEATRAQALEGVVAKRVDAPYEPGRRSAAWVKVKHRLHEEVVIGGWLPGEGKRRDSIGALLVGVPDRGDPSGLRYAGRVGTGFSEATLADLRRRLEPLERDENPFGAGQGPRDAVHVAPVLRCRVEHAEWTKERVLRQPSFQGLVDEPFQILRETAKGGRELCVDGRVLPVSNWHKPLWPSGATKADLVSYLVRVAPVLLPHLARRPLTLKRYPDGADAQHFYEKHSPKYRPEWVATAHVQGIDFTVVDGPATLAWLGAIADLELHTPMARVDAIDTPTMVVFDLDPGAPAALAQCCEVALVLRGLFERLGLECFPKTSGSKGLQLYIPLNVDGVTHEQTKAFAKQVAELLEAQMGDLVVSRQRKELRRGKVLVDWSQNDDHKTTVTVYSPRARDRPTVSTPLTWDEVERGRAGRAGAASLVFDLEAVLARVEEHGDLFAPVLSKRQALPGL